MQCGRVGSRPLSTTEGFHGHAPWEPSLHLEANSQPRDPPPAPPSEGRGVECPRQATSESSKGRALSLGDCALPTTVGSSFASDCWGGASCPTVGPCLVSDCRNRSCAGPKVMLGRFSMTRLQPHVGRTQIIHYVLYIEKERYCSTAFQMTRIYGERQLRIVWRLPRLVDCSSIS